VDKCLICSVCSGTLPDAIDLKEFDEIQAAQRAVSHRLGQEGIGSGLGI
jgi:hypothetical protein